MRTANQGRVRGGRRAMVVGLGLWCAVLVGNLAVVPSGRADEATVPYSNPAFGFEMQVPAGWTYDRARYQGPAGALGLLRGERPDGTEILEILIYRSFEMKGFPAWVDAFASELGKLHGTKQVEVKRWKKASPRPGALLTLDVKVGGYLTRTHYVCVPFDPSTVWVAALASRVPDKSAERALRKRFEEIAGSLSISYDPVEVEQIAAAFDRGMVICRKLKTTASEVSADGVERYYDIRVGGKSIGYLMRWMRREHQALDDPRFSGRSKEGLRVHEESWRFADDGTVRCTELDMFSSLDMRSELIENRSTQIPATDVASQRLYIELDQCVREGNGLFSSFSTNVNAELPDPRPPVPIGPRYLDLAWVRMLPRLLRDAPSEMHAFAVYDSQTRALTVYTIRPLGPDKIPGPGGGAGYAFEVGEGFATRPSRVYTDAMGNVVRIEAGDLVVQSTTKDDVERRYSDRRAPARLRLQRPAFSGGSRP